MLCYLKVSLLAFQVRLLHSRPSAVQAQFILTEGESWRLACLLWLWLQCYLLSLLFPADQSHMSDVAFLMKS